MELFESETITISKIFSVNRYDPKSMITGKHTIYHPVNLATHELIFFFSGDRITEFDGRKLHNIPDSIMYLPKGARSGDYKLNISTSCASTDIFFDTDDEMPDHAIAIKDLNELSHLFEKIHVRWISKKTGFYADCMSLFYEIIKKIQIHNKIYSTNSNKNKIEPSYNYMIEHFCEQDFDYKKMCSESSLSYDYFKELFIKQYGTSPVKYVTKLRIEKAEELLITGLYSVTEIAEMCGFENVYYFSNVFKKYTGVSPKNYYLTLTKFTI